MEILLKIIAIVIGLAVMYWAIHTAPDDYRVSHYYSKGPVDWDSGYDQ